jgi:hypothetical protein
MQGWDVLSGEGQDGMRITHEWKLRGWKWVCRWYLICGFRLCQMRQWAVFRSE